MTNTPSWTLTDLSCLSLGMKVGFWVSPDLSHEDLETHYYPPERLELSMISAKMRLIRPQDPPILVCHAPSLKRRLSLKQAPFLDILELYAFLYPTRTALPTISGLCRSLNFKLTRNAAEEAAILPELANYLLSQLNQAARHKKLSPDLPPIALTMAQAGWQWGPFLLDILQQHYNQQDFTAGNRAFQTWHALPEWSEQAPEPPPGQEPVSGRESRARLHYLRGAGAEQRPAQESYAEAAAVAFTPRNQQDQPHLVLAEAGTGIGKTLGYLAPASLWADKNMAPVWISTYTRHLQHQIDHETNRLFASDQEKARHVVIRKGRENYLCLLNFEESVYLATGQFNFAAANAAENPVIAMGLMARWVGKTRDGDMTGGDYPSWLTDLLGHGRSLGLSDRRGECIYAACSHYHRCFIERSIRRARRAKLVIANHALVLIQAAQGGQEGQSSEADFQLPSRYVFDEAHHLFDAADSSFSAHLSGQETLEFRRWLVGPEESPTKRARSRARGLKRRLEDLLSDDPAAHRLIDQALQAAQALTHENWSMRLQERLPQGECEIFLDAIAEQVFARAPKADTPYGIESPLHPPLERLVEVSLTLINILSDIHDPLHKLVERFRYRLEAEAADLDSQIRQRLGAMSDMIERRALTPLAAWKSMLEHLTNPPPQQEDVPHHERHVDWLSIDRHEGRVLDIGLHRHWVDPTWPLAKTLQRPAHGILMTSATLTDGSGQAEMDWLAARLVTGADHFDGPLTQAEFDSPFDYPAQTEIIIVNDLDRNRLSDIAGAYQALFQASKGGALGVFTAISRLRAVYQQIAPALEQNGLKLLAQHVDNLDTATLVDIFRQEQDSCLLGTDAVRDGVDVPGTALRLLVYDRLPWPRPHLLHKARREAFGGRRYDDHLTRQKLRQAFGRLVRRSGDRGIFVILENRFPSRLKGAFPENVQITHCDLQTAIARIAAFDFEPVPQLSPEKGE